MNLQSLKVSKSGEVVLLEAEALRSKTTMSAEAKTLLLPYVALGTVVFWSRLGGILALGL